MNDWSDDKKVAASLFRLKNFMVCYHAVTKMILSITTDEELMYGDVFDDTMIHQLISV